MKQIIKVELRTRKGDYGTQKTDLLAVGVCKDGKRSEKILKGMDEIIGGAIGNLKKLGDFKAEVKSCTVLYGDGKTAAKRILLVGLGEAKKVTANTIREAAAIAGSKAVDIKAKQTVLAIHQCLEKRLNAERIGKAIAEGVCFGSYRYDEFVTKEENGRLKELSFEILDSNAANLRALNKGSKVGNIVGQAQSFARTMANRPGNIINPAKLADEAKKMAKATGLSCTVLDEKQLKQKKMGGILAVGEGSKSKPRLIILKYQPKNKKAKKTIGIVGKAITFDSGGISIKPANNMDEMKFDKSGGIAVLGAMKAIAEIKPAVNVYGLIPSAENLPSGTSYRPGDIVTTFSGKTVEVQNTDAEGRMILCDALNYAAKQGCETIIDLATLTGACYVALGKYMAGVMSNDEKLVKELRKAAEESDEKIWPMPCGEEYLQEMKSKIADLKNIGSKWGGACTAAAFLGQFVEDKKWAHIDIAGVGMNCEYKHLGCVGSAGFGVRLLVDYLLNEAKGK